MKKMKNIAETEWANLGAGKLEKYWNIAIDRSEYIADFVAKYNCSSIFEVGFFSGRNLYYIQKKIPDIKLGGLDINKYATAYAEKKIKNAELECGNILTMDVKKKYDIVFTCGTLIHIPEIDLALEKCLDKANKYVIHFETNGDDKIMYGPKSINPANVSKRFEWFPNIYKRYSDKNMNVEIMDVPQRIDAIDVKNIIIVKKGIV